MKTIIKGTICYSKTPQLLSITESGYLICENGFSTGVYEKLPEKYLNHPVTDYDGCLIIPGLCDLHVHAPQYAFRGLGLDMELLGWLQTYAYPEEAKYSDMAYVDKAYTLFADAMLHGATTRACVYATVHKQATLRLMEKLEQAGIVSMVGMVAMDRNCPEVLRYDSTESAYNEMEAWIKAATEMFHNTTPIITPRFIPSCTDEMMNELAKLQKEYSLPVQSHLSENKAEIDWVKELCPTSETYSHAYEQFGLFGGDGVQTVMAHCVWLSDTEQDLIKQNNVYVAHCPQSNTNLASGIAPIRKYMQKGLNIGLGSDVAGGSQLSIFRAMSDAIQVSKLNHCLVSEDSAPLTINEVFYLATLGGGSFFGKVGSFEPGFEFDAVIVKDDDNFSAYPLSTEERISRLIHCPEENHIVAKYAKGKKLL